MKTYFQKGNLIVRDSKEDDILPLAENMRECDRQEIWDSHHKTPIQAIHEGFKDSIICFTIELDSVPIAIFGIVPESILGLKAAIWLLASPEIDKIKVEFVRNSKYFIDIMLTHYSLLENQVNAENRKTIKWLTMCGAKFEPEAPYGLEQKLFCHFKFNGRN